MLQAVKANDIMVGRPVVVKRTTVCKLGYSHACFVTGLFASST